MATASTIATPATPLLGIAPVLYRISVNEYERMVDAGGKAGIDNTSGRCRSARAPFYVRGWRSANSISSARDRGGAWRWAPTALLTSPAWRLRNLEFRM